MCDLADCILKVTNFRCVCFTDIGGLTTTNKTIQLGLFNLLINQLRESRISPPK